MPLLSPGWPPVIAFATPSATPDMTFPTTLMPGGTGGDPGGAGGVGAGGVPGDAEPDAAVFFLEYSTAPAIPTEAIPSTTTSGTITLLLILSHKARFHAIYFVVQFR